MPGKHMFASRAQWRWAFATHQPWARRWAEANETSLARGYHRLSRRKSPPGTSRALKAFASKGSKSGRAGSY